MRQNSQLSRIQQICTSAGGIWGKARGHSEPPASVMAAASTLTCMLCFPTVGVLILADVRGAQGSSTKRRSARASPLPELQTDPVCAASGWRRASMSPCPTNLKCSLDRISLGDGRSRQRQEAPQIICPCGGGVLGQGPRHLAAHHAHDVAPSLAGGDHHRLDLHRRDAAAVHSAPARAGHRPGAGRHAGGAGAAAEPRCGRRR